MSLDARELRPEQDDGPYCPHFDNVDEETLRRLFSKVAAVRSEDRDLFDFTHREIEVFRAPQGTVQDAQVVSEEQIYQQFSEEASGNFAIVIEGEVGTGKSELCAYLAHRLADDGRPILHVDKDDDLMSLLTERIPEFYREEFGEELEGTSEFEQLRHDIENNPQTVANNATSGAVLNLSGIGYDIDIDEGQESDFRDHVCEELQQLTERGEYAKEVKFVTTGDYNQKDFLDVFATGPGVERPDSGEEAVEVLNTELWREIRNRYGTASLNEVLQRVGSAFEDTRPVIVFEDFSITAMEGKQLRNYMERDKASDNWDFIVAGTRDSTGVLHTQTAEDRFEFYQTNEPDSNSVRFLDQASAVDFIRPYLGYFKSLDGDENRRGSVEYTGDSDTGELYLQEAPAGSICAECGLCDESFRDLFPFHAPFLQRIYTGLNSSEQSPREYVMKVFEVLEEYYKGYVDAPSSASALGPLEDPLIVPDAVEEHSDELADLFRWYGTEDDDGGALTVDLRFAVVFGVVDPIDHESLPEEVTVTDAAVTVSAPGEEPGPGSGPEPGSGSGSEPPKLSPVEREINEHRRKLGPWQTYPSQNTQTGVYLRSGLGDALERLTDGFALYEGTPLRYKLSSQKYPFVFTNTDDVPEEFQIDIDPEEFQSSDFRRVLEFGVRRNEEPRSADYDGLFERLGTQLTAYADDWRRQLRETYLNADDVLYKRHARYDFTDFVLAAYAMVVIFDSPWQELSAETLNERFASGDDFELDPGIDDWCQDALDVDQYGYVTDMIEYADYLEDMVEELLAVSSSALDLPRVRDRLDRHPPYEVLNQLGRRQINEIDGRVMFRNGPRLKNVVDTAYDFRKAIDELNDFGPRTEVVETVGADLDDIELEAVKEIVRGLETYDGVSPEVLESLNRFTDLSQDDIDQVTTIADRVQELYSSVAPPAEQLQAILMSVKLEASQAYRRYDDVVVEPGGGNDGLGQTFMEVSDYYVE